MDIFKSEIRKLKNEKRDSELKDRTKKFAVDIVRFYTSMPKTTESQVIGKQLLRSGTSVGANTRAAFRGRSTKEFVAKLGIVVEEADESCFWLEVLEELKLIKDNKSIKSLLREANELTKIFNSIRHKFK